MPTTRRYPRLSANDHAGHSVAIPIAIAPKLLPHEDFVSLSQEKVYQIAEANERISKMENDTNRITDTNKSDDVLPMKKREADNSSTRLAPSQGEESESCITDTPSSSQEAVRESSNTEISVPSSGTRRSKRLWTDEEDEIVLCAVMMKEPGKRVVERLSHRSRSAVMQRFYMIKERHEKALADAEDSECEDLDDGDAVDGVDDEMEVLTEEVGGFCEDDDMDEIPPL